MAAPTGKFRMNEGDWVCVDSQCGNVNFARRTSCNRCGKEKDEVAKKTKLGTEIGKAAADKSGGLFSADDWQCSKCGNVNWARRQSCNMCNAPKFGEVEERTGYGGGFNERENVEYVERDDSDGEYDEFGRKKKKFRGHGDSSPGNEARTEPKLKVEVAKHVQPANKNEEEEEEDDEDDDDEDGDLSKYDLSGWGEEGDDADAKDNEKDGGGSKLSSSSNSGGSKKKSRSRSKSPSSASKGSHSSKESRSPAGGGGSSSRHKRRTSRSRSRSSSDDSKSKRRLGRGGSSRSGSDSKSRDRSRSRSGS